MDKKKQQKIIIEQKEKLARDAAKLEQQWAGLDEGQEWVPTYTSRHEVPPPEPRDKSRYNPNNIVDIELFVTHPHYLNLQPYPWQILALKLFYAGSEGNSNLEFNDAKKDEETGCDRCVWKYVVDNEIACSEALEKEEHFQSILTPQNSRCLKCSRCPLAVRCNRLNHEIESAVDVDSENTLKNILASETEDLFQSEEDLIESITDETIKAQVKNKLRNKFQELVLIIGRRGTKSFLTVTIALYEIYKLLSMGHPQKKLKLPDFQEIHILNVANNENQARDSIFTPMKNAAVSSPFFQKYIGVDNALELKFLTEKDIEENERRAAKGLNPITGTIIALCGSSSASGLVGKTCWCIILDEIAAMAGDNPNSGIDKKLYNELKPSLTTFGKDGKIICLSNPKGPFGQLYQLYTSRVETKDTLILKLPTWVVNANVDLLWLEAEREKDPIEYNMQYGAEFGTNSQDPYLSPEDVEHAFNYSAALTRLEEREPQVEYYCHIDPANRSDYYTIVVSHAIPTGELTPDGRPVKKFFIDHIHFWAPIKMKQPVSTKAVEEYIINLNNKFKFKQISYDQWGAMEMMDRLAGYGLPCALKVFNKEYKDKIYLHLLEIFRDKRIEFYRMSAGKVEDVHGKIIDIHEIPEAKTQFTFLQKKWRNGRQIIEALTGYKDDICDAVAAATYEANTSSVVVKTLPRSRVAYTGYGFR